MIGLRLTIPSIVKPMGRETSRIPPFCHGSCFMIVATLLTSRKGIRPLEVDRPKYNKQATCPSDTERDPTPPMSMLASMLSSEAENLPDASFTSKNNFSPRSVELMEGISERLRPETSSPTWTLRHYNGNREEQEDQPLAIRRRQTQPQRQKTKNLLYVSACTKGYVPRSITGIKTSKVGTWVRPEYLTKETGVLSSKYLQRPVKKISDP